MTQAQPEDTPDAPPPVEDIKPEPMPPDNQIVPDEKPDPTPPVPQPEVKVPELPRRDKAEAVLAPPPQPKPKPKPEKKLPPRVREVENMKPIQPDRQKQRRSMAPPSSQALHSDVVGAPSAASSGAASMSAANWKGGLMAHLNRYKRYPAGASGGTVSVAFTITRSGQVLSARVIGSSSDPALDAEAAALPRRASPLPAPPAGIGGGGSISLTVPIRFSR